MQVLLRKKRLVLVWIVRFVTGSQSGGDLQRGAKVAVRSRIQTVGGRRGRRFVCCQLPRLPGDGVSSPGKGKSSRAEYQHPADSQESETRFQLVGLHTGLYKF